MIYINFFWLFLITFFGQIYTMNKLKIETNVCKGGGLRKGVLKKERFYLRETISSIRISPLADIPTFIHNWPR